MINFVYITTDLSTGKQYVGDHCTENIDDNYLGSGTYLKRVIKKYGRKNFKREILEFFDTKEEAFNAQEKYINEYNTLSPNGYNISPKGGSQIVGGLSEETRRKIGLAGRGRISPRKGVKLSEETKDLIRESRTGDKNWNWGKKRKKATRNKISETLKIPILQISKEGDIIKRWESLKGASDHFGIPRGNICRVCKGRGHLAGGYKWKYIDNEA